MGKAGKVGPKDPVLIISKQTQGAAHNADECACSLAAVGLTCEESQPFWPADDKKSCLPFRYHSFVMTPDPRTPSSQSSAAMTPAQKASRLLELHHADSPLLLIN